GDIPRRINQTGQDILCISGRMIFFQASGIRSSHYSSNETTSMRPKYGPKANLQQEKIRSTGNNY
ncbi:MAG: hypothetical protein R6Y91_01005, partial [Desulfohalobium sp.]